MTARMLYSLRTPVEALRDYVPIGTFYESIAPAVREQTYAEADLVGFFLKQGTVPVPFQKNARERIESMVIKSGVSFPDNWANLFADASPYVLSRVLAHDYKETHPIPKNFVLLGAYVSNTLIAAALEEKVIMPPAISARAELGKHAKALLEFGFTLRSRTQERPPYQLRSVDQ